MNEFIGTSAEPDMAEITGGAPAGKTAEVVPEEDDPFAVNVIQPKRRKKKSAKDDDDDDDDDEDDEKPKRKRRSAGRRKAPKRKRS